MTGDEIKAARAALGLTQTQMAAMVGLTRSAVARMEVGAPVMDATRRLIAAYLSGYRPPDWPSCQKTSKKLT